MLILFMLDQSTEHRTQLNLEPPTEYFVKGFMKLNFEQTTKQLFKVDRV